ncbi:MAG: VCBS repeat-containing protein [Desulfamplus sp.]|nr:VCBS repeat-containing protein [Desulfamplus sp.]
MKNTNAISGRSTRLSGFFTKSYQMRNAVFIMVMACSLLFSSFLTSTSAHAQAVKIAVLPFEINAEQNLDFLKNGIQDMLNSRLSFKDEIIVIDKERVEKVAGSIKGFTGENFALLVGGQLKADFVINGSITVIGNSTSIDSKLIDISGKNPPISFFRQSEDPGGVIPAINQFATTINETIFNRSSGTDQKQVMAITDMQPNISTSESRSSSALTAAPIQNHQLNSSFIVKNQDASTATDQVGSPNPEFSVTSNARTNKSSAWKSPTFKHLINAISLGDTDRDNLTETVFVSDHSLYIYRFSDNRFIKTAEPAKSKLSTYIGVDVGDINGNGIDEIFVTSLNPDKNMPNSFVIEYNGSKYVKIAKNMPWYFRVVRTKNGDKVLLGQKQKSNKQNIYSSPIYKMRWNGTEYAPDQKVLESDRANVIGTLFEDITGDKTSTILAYNQAEHLTLYSNSGNVLWRDVNSSGGSMNYFQLPKESPSDDPELEYFPLPVIAADINGDGNMEILYALNNDVTGGYLSKFKKYNKGAINCSFWNASGLSLQWSTPEQPGRVSGFVIGDFDNDGAEELVISNVIKDALSTFADSESSIIVYELMQ